MTLVKGVPRSALDALRQVPLFSSCTDKELRTIAGLGTPVDIGADAALTRTGSRGREFFIVLSGEVSCIAQGTEVARFGPGDFFGEMSLLDGEPRSAEVRTLTAVTVLVLDRSEFLRLMESSPVLALKVITSMAQRLRKTTASLHH
jgi:CRP/FNR family transcriptional regulator/CRP/FNR family cyclic AMP-dependent transcriptional regulator